MKISRFVGANSREVMRQVRQMLGPDALIVSNRSVDGGVEVLATVDGAFDDAPSESGQRESSAGSGRDPIASGAASEAASGFAAGVAPGNAPNAAPASTPYAAPSASPLSAPGFAPGFAPGVTPGFAPAFASPAASHAASPSTQHAVPPSAQHSMPPSAQHSMPPSAQPPASRPAYLAGPAGAASPATASSPFGTPAPSQPASYVTPARSIAAYQSAFASSALPEDETPGEQGAAPQAAAPELAASRSAAPQAAAPQAAAPQSGVLPATSALAAAATRVELPALPAARPPLSAPPPVSMPSPGMHAQPPVSMPPPGTHAQPPVSMPSPGMRAQPPVAMPYPGMRAQPPVAMPSPGMHAQPPVAMPSPGMHAQPPVAMPSPDMRAQPPVSMPSPGMHAQSPATSAQPPVAMPSSAMAAQQSAAMPPSSMTAQPPVAAPAPVAYAASAGAAAYAAHSAAAAHTAPAAPSAPAASAASMARTPDAPLRQPSPSATLPSAALPTDTAAGLQDAISALRGALETRMDGLLWGGRQGSAREAAAAALFRSLLDAGFSTKLVRALVERLPQGLSTEAAQAWARNELVTHLPVVASEDEFLAGGVYALVGPTGVGKTTTLAKLAARCVAREGRDQVAMLTTDLFRIGALEQLQIYGRLMGVPAHSVRDAGELRRILNELGNRKIVLIDTTGISQRDRLVAEQAAMLCNAGKPVRRLLVLNAASQGDTLDEVAHAYRNGVGEDVAGCIITKLDEATRLGAALDTAIRHRLPIHYMSVGQKVPEHMELARADVLIDRAFGMVERARALYTPSEADLASLLPTARDADAVDPARRRQLLASAILRPQGGSASITAAQNLDHTIAMLDNDPACVQARASWRDYVGDGAGASLAALGDEPLAMVRREFSANSNRHLLVMHGKTNMKGENLPGGTMMGSLLMSDRGVALAAPAQQLALAHGMLTSFAPAAAGLPDAGPALEARVRWLGEQLPRLPLVHMLEAGTPALWQSLSGQGASWVARCPGGMRVIQEECPTNLNAVGKSVGYLPVGQPGDMPGLIRETAAKRTPLALWASGTEITLPGRGETTSMRLVCARLIDTATGEVDTQLFGLTNLPASQADAATVARWLVLQDEAKAAFRYVASAWQALPAVDGSHTLARQSLMAGQLGAACWQMAHSPSADVVRGPLSGIMGTDRKLSGRLLPVAILKMFAMLEMTGGA